MCAKNNNKTKTKQQQLKTTTKVLLFSHSIVPTLRHHGLQHTRLPCPSLSPGVCSNSCPLSRRCHPTISSPLTTFSPCPQAFPASGFFPMNSSGKSCHHNYLQMLEQEHLCFKEALGGEPWHPPQSLTI